MKSWTVALATLAASWSVAQAPLTMTILHTNDIHSRLEPAIVARQPYGGYARVSTLIKRFRRTDPNPIVLNAGDTFQGTLYFNVYGGLADATLMNLTGYQAMALGNHEFDNGVEGLEPFLRSVQFPVLCANMDFSREPRLRNAIQPSTVLWVGGQRVGIIGVMTPDLFDIANPGSTVTMKPLDASIAQEIDNLEKQNINKIILLSHLGYNLDQQVARNHPRLDVIVGGHSHSFLGNLKIEGFPPSMGPYPTVVGKTMIVQAWEWAKLLGRMTLDFNAAGEVVSIRNASPVPVDATVAEDPIIQAAIRAFRKPIEQLQNEVVGETKNGLDRNSSLGPELPMGNVIADAQLAFVQRTGAVMAFMNRGGIRAEIDAGPITYGELIGVQPFGNTMVVMDVTGKDILDMLEVGAGKGSLVQVSKRVSYRVREATPKVFDLRFNGEPIQMEKTYRIVVNNFMARGGDGFVSLQNAKGYRLDTGYLDLDVMIAYFKANNPVDMTREGRIQLAN